MTSFNQSLFYFILASLLFLGTTIGLQENTDSLSSIKDHVENPTQTPLK